MKLYLMRHGEYLTDDIRQGNPLSEKGQNDIHHIANFLNPLKIHVAHLFHSEKLRAKQTADLLSHAIFCDNGAEKRPGLNPLDNVSTFSDELNSWEEDVFVVGHLPFMSNLLGLLVAQNKNKDLVVFQPGTLVCLEKIETGRWMISWTLCPTLFN